MKHTILLLAANPLGTDRLALDREARAIQVELERSSFRDSFELVTRWATEPLDLLRELRRLKPSVVHFSGHGNPDVAGLRNPAAGPHLDAIVEHSPADRAPQHGLFFQGPDGRLQFVSTAALENAFDAAGSSVKLVVLNACYSDPQAAALLTRVGCVVGMRGSIRDDTARNFAIGFYGGLGERESVAAAYKQGCAAIDLENLPDADRPQLKTRYGVDAAHLILASAPQTSSQTGTSPGPAPKVDIGILTIRDDEFRAVLAAFPDKEPPRKNTSHKYTIHYANTGDGKRYRIAIARLLEHGNGEARDAAQDLIDELAPTLVLVVGIAGASPLEHVKLGDVVVSTWIHGFTMEVRKTSQEPEDSVIDDIAHPSAHARFEYAGQEIKYFVTDGPIDKAMAAFVTNLAAYEDELGSWTMDLPPPPPVTWESDGQLYGPPDWQSELRDKLTYHYGTSATSGAPVYSAGPIAASNRFVKDPELLIPWLKTARALQAIEMESAGVDRAIRGRCPMLAIRGISDIVGLKRSDAWAKYACASAAAFTRAFLRTRPAGDPS